MAKARGRRQHKHQTDEEVNEDQIDVNVLQQQNYGSEINEDGQQPTPSIQW